MQSQLHYELLIWHPHGIEACVRWHTLTRENKFVRSSTRLDVCYSKTDIQDRNLFILSSTLFKPYRHNIWNVTICYSIATAWEMRLVVDALMLMRWCLYHVLEQHINFAVLHAIAPFLLHACAPSLLHACAPSLLPSLHSFAAVSCLTCISGNKRMHQSRRTRKGKLQPDKAQPLLPGSRLWTANLQTFWKLAQIRGSTSVCLQVYQNLLDTVNVCRIECLIMLLWSQNLGL